MRFSNPVISELSDIHGLGPMSKRSISGTLPPKCNRFPWKFLSFEISALESDRYASPQISIFSVFSQCSSFSSSLSRSNDRLDSCVHILSRFHADFSIWRPSIFEKMQFLPKESFFWTCLSQLNFSDPLRPLQQKFFFGALTLVKFWPKIFRKVPQIIPKDLRSAKKISGHSRWSQVIPDDLRSSHNI